MKKCSRCQEEKDLSCFPKDKNRRDGVFCYCKDCANNIQRERYALKVQTTYPVRHGLKVRKGHRASKIRVLGIDLVNTLDSRVDNFDDIEFARGCVQRLYD